MRFRKVIACTAAVLILTAPRVAAQETTPPSRVLPVAVGVVGGVVAGGYLALAIVVLESRFGRYIHDERDILGWRSVPLLVGATVGGGLGVLDPDRLYRTVLLGAIGFAAGVGGGLAVGKIFGETPEALWAGGAIGGGVGIVIGNLLGVLLPHDSGPGQVNVFEARVPLQIRIPF
jgi:hypothetical protein